MPHTAHPTPPWLVLATRNPKKHQEMAALISPPWDPDPVLARFDIRTLADFPDVPEVVEDGDTFAANAAKKANAAAQHLGCWVVADDSGLAVDALSGAPGVRSARYAGTHGDDEANNAKLLKALESIPEDQRGAAFVCALAVADASGAIVAQVEASCRGRITREPRGTNGFGYDPLFLIREYHRTLGELSTLVKHQISHRSRAFARLRPLLRSLLVDRT